MGKVRAFVDQCSSTNLPEFDTVLWLLVLPINYVERLLSIKDKDSDIIIDPLDSHVLQTV